VKEEKWMYKLFGVLLSAAVFCLASPMSYCQELAVNSASESGDNVARFEEHVRHIRAHKRPNQASDTDQAKETPSATQAVVKQIEGGLARKYPQAKPSKKKLQAQIVKSKVATDKAAISRPATPSKPGDPKPTGFFEELFNQD
jgi:hypothetical protein